MTWLLLGLLLLAVLILAGGPLFVNSVAGPVLVWLDRLADRWAFRGTHRLKITKLPDGFQIHEWESKERATWDC